MTIGQKLAYMANNDIAEVNKFTMLTEAVAARRGVSIKTVGDACRRGVLRAIKKDKVWMIDEDSFKNWHPVRRAQR